MLKLSEEGKSKAKPRSNARLLVPVSQVANAKEKVLKEMKSAAPVDTCMIRKQESYWWYEENLRGLEVRPQPATTFPSAKA